MPLPTTTARSPGLNLEPIDGVQGDRDRLDERRVLERQLGRQRVEDVLRHGDELGERAVLAIVVAGDAEHAAVGAQIHLAAAAGVALAAGDRGIERHAVADSRAIDVAADFDDSAGRFVAHDDRRNAPAARAVVAVDVAAADAAGGDADEHVVRAERGPVHRYELELAVFGEQEGLHVDLGPTLSVGSGVRRSASSVLTQMPQSGRHRVPTLSV